MKTSLQYAISLELVILYCRLTSELTLKPEICYSMIFYSTNLNAVDENCTILIKIEINFNILIYYFIYYFNLQKIK